MTFDITHDFVTCIFDGDNRNTCLRVFGQNMQDYRKTDLKLQHGTDLKSALKS